MRIALKKEDAVQFLAAQPLFLTRTASKSYPSAGQDSADAKISFSDASTHILGEWQVSLKSNRSNRSLEALIETSFEE